MYFFTFGKNINGDCVTCNLSNREVAHLGYFRQELVTSREWIDEAGW